MFDKAELLSNDEGSEPEGFGVKFDNVTFAYKDTEVLKNVSFTAKQDSVTVIVGSSGAGKSTIAKLLCRFWDVQGGTVMIGSRDIRNIPFNLLLNAISYVSQDNFLFDMSIMENLRLGNPNASDEEIIEAARQTQCHSFTMELPDGYQTIVGEAGGRLLGGQRQRLTIVRSMLKNAPIVVLDEATSATNAENEDLIQTASECCCGIGLLC